MKRICIITPLLFLLTTSLLAQFRLTGKVSGAQQPLVGATIVVNTLKTITGPDGAFVVANLKPGSYLVTISYAGYETQQKTIELTQSTLLPVALTPLNVVLQNVEVKALRASDKAPFAKTNLDKNYIEQNNLGQDIPFLLNQTPGVVINSDAGNGVGYTGIRIRGSDASRINMTINGIPYNDAESQGTFFVNMPDFLSSVSSVQIQRGVGTSSNGGGAFGASMNFSTHEYNPEAYGEINNSVGSFQTVKNTLKFGTGLLGKKFTVDARLSHLSSEGYVDRASSKLLGAYASAAYWGEKSSLKFNVMLGKEKTYQAWNGINVDDLKNNRTYNSAGTEKPGEPFDNETDNYWQNHYQLIYTRQLKPRLSFNTALYLTTGRGYYEQYKAGEDPADYGFTGAETDLVRRLWLRNKLFGQVFSLQHNGEKQQLTVGGGWSYYPGKHIGEVIWTEANPNMNHQWYNHKAGKTDANIYGKWQYGLSKNWSLFADLQYRYVSYQITGFRNNPNIAIDQQWHFLNPKAGIHYSNNDWSGFFSYAMGNKEPNRDDFEADFTQLPRHEQVHDFELNISRKNLLEGWHAGITLYRMQYKDQLALTGKINDVGAYTRTNIPQSYRMGAELETQYQWANGAIRYNIALSRNRLISFNEFIDDYDAGGQLIIEHNNKPIALSPDVVQSASILYSPLKNLDLEWLSKYVGHQFLDNTGNKDRSLDPFFVNDLRMSYTIRPKKILKEIKLVTQVFNQFNVLYAPNGYTFSYIYGGEQSTENYYYPMAGRNFMAAVQIKF